MNNRFNTTSNFDVNMTSNANQRFEVITPEVDNNISIEDNNTSVIIPIKTSKNVSLNVDTNSGTFLKYIIDNETGSNLELDDGVLKLLSKTGKLLSAITIPKELPDYKDLRDRYLYVDPFGNLTWGKSGEAGGAYSSGAAISISPKKEINLVYDTNTLYINDEGKVTVNLDKVQRKLVAGENIAIEGNTISARDTTYKAGKGIFIDEYTNEISTSIESNDYVFLKNKPSINGVTLLGALLGSDLKLDVVQYMGYKEYRNLEHKERKFYFVCKNNKDIEAENCWRIYLQNKLVGEWDVESGIITLPKFPMRFPFRFS